MSRRLAAPLLLAGLIAILMLALVGPASGGNSQLFEDAVGDNQGAGTGFYAVDIISARATSQDDGLISFAVTIRTESPQGGNLENGDAVGVYVDSDHNQSTGDEGYEAAFRAYGATGEAPYAEFCRVVETQLSCEPIGSENFSSVVTPPNTQVLTFTLYQSNWFTVQFLVATQFTTNFDYAPDDAFFEYDVRADPDGDGVSGQGDSCPNKSGGRFDRDFDGCPGPLKTLPKIGIRYSGLSKSSSSIRFSSFGVTGIPSQAGVKVRAGGSTFTRRGSGSIGGLANRTLSAGQTITITVSRTGWCTQVRVIRIKPQAANGYINVSERVVHPAGVECT